MVKRQETLGLKYWRAEGTGNPVGNFHASAKNKCHNKRVPPNISEVYSKRLLMHIDPTETIAIC